MAALASMLNYPGEKPGKLAPGELWAAMVKSHLEPMPAS